MLILQIIMDFPLKVFYLIEDIFFKMKSLFLMFKVKLGMKFVKFVLLKENKSLLKVVAGILFVKNVFKS